MLIKIKLTNLLQIFCEFKINLKVILKSIKGPDNPDFDDIILVKAFEVDILMKPSGGVRRWYFAGYTGFPHKLQLANHDLAAIWQKK